MRSAGRGVCRGDRVRSRKVQFAPTHGKPRPVHVLKRGNEKDPRRKLAREHAAICPQLESRFQVDAGADEGARRAALARWLIDKRNPLTWRSIVNRVWQYHFGRGIVDSPNDFGRMGAMPTHPELLDWLAAEFRDGPQSIKQLHRLICTSAVYRQSSAGNAEFEKLRRRQPIPVADESPPAGGGGGARLGAGGRRATGQHSRRATVSRRSDLRTISRRTTIMTNTIPTTRFRTAAACIG